MSKRKALFIAASASFATELVAVACLTHVGGEGPADVVGWVGMILAYPTLRLAQCCDGLSTPVLLGVGFMQFFVVYVGAVLVWRHLSYGRKAASYEGS